MRVSQAAILPFVIVSLPLRSAIGAQVPDAALPTGSVRVGIRVDTSTAPRREIFALWRRYLADGPDRFKPNPAWSRTETQRWPLFDLTAPWVYFSAPGYPRPEPTVLSIEPAEPGRDDVYVIRTLFTTTDSLTHGVLPVALNRVYAVREDGRWVLANALPRLTAGWSRARRGVITFVYPPTHRFDAARAERSAQFVDSLSRVFGVRRPPNIEFYVLDRPEELSRILGLDLALPETNNGRAYPTNNLIFSGLPVYGEWYPHELTHLVLWPLVRERRASMTMDEGLAHWLGGSKGKPFSTLMRELEDDLEARPDLVLDSLVGPGGRRDSVANRAAAALLKLAHDRGGIDAVKAVLTPVQTSRGPNHLLAAEQALGMTRQDLEAAWRLLVRQGAR
jgi:hypothetical protein